MEDDYSTLVKRILENKILTEHVDYLMDTEAPRYSKPNTLNLVTKNWSTILAQDSHFQNFQFRPEINQYSSNQFGFESSKESIFNVLVAGYCRFAKPYQGQENQSQSVVFSNSAPLSQIARVMTRDLGQLLISDEFKFSFVPTCTISTCTYCKESAKRLKQYKEYWPIKKLQPCITRTKIFNGKEIVNRFQNHIVDHFPKSFVTIMHLTINRRYHYTDVSNANQKLYRIGGVINNAVIFEEAHFDSLRSIHLGDLSDIELVSEPLTSCQEKHLETMKCKDTELEDKSYIGMYNSSVEQTQLPTENIGMYHSSLDQNQTHLNMEEEESKFNSLTEQDNTSLMSDDDLFATEGDPLELKRMPDNEDFFSIESESKAKRPRCEESFLSID